jgi:hypothetical protein
MELAMSHDTFHFTLFDDQFALGRMCLTATLDQMAHNISVTHKDSKSELPWVKMALFGNNKGETGCYRRNENVIALTGCEGDYDGGPITFAKAIKRLKKAGIAGMLYTTPSNSDKQPHWRILCPLSAPSYGTPAELQQKRDDLLDALNAILGGGLAGESWTLSQSYYFGNVNGRTPVQVHVQGGNFIDLSPALPRKPRKGRGLASKTATSKTATSGVGAGRDYRSEPMSEEQLFEMAVAAAEACRDVHYPELIKVIMAVSRTNVVGHEDNVCQREAARIIWDANVVSESLTDAKFTAAFEAPMQEGAAITPATFFRYARLGRWRRPLSATYTIPNFPGCMPLRSYTNA